MKKERGIEKGQDEDAALGDFSAAASGRRVLSASESDAKDTAAASPRNRSLGSVKRVVWTGAGRTQPVTQAATFRACRGTPLYNYSAKLHDASPLTCVSAASRVLFWNGEITRNGYLKNI